MSSLSIAHDDPEHGESTTNPPSRAGTPASLSVDECSPTSGGYRARLHRNNSIESLELEAEKTQQPMVWKIVLTGGPCGGKTTALSIIADRLRSLGLQVFTVPENATMFSNSGAGFPVHSHKEHQLTWETSRMICQMQMEDSFESIAKASHRPTVILCDRGVVDACAYMDAETWQQVLCSMDWNEKSLRDDRYDLILHMVSTAVGAEDCYVNTVYRHETPSQAAALDVKIQQAWKLHRKRCEVDNSTGYDEKVSRAVDILCSGIGIVSGTSKSSRTYLLETDFMAKHEGMFPSFAENITTIIVFLQNSTCSKSYSFLRLRKHHDACLSFAQGSKTPGAYKERHISQAEFLQSLPLALPQSCFTFEKKVWMAQNENHDTLSYELSVHDTFCTLKVCIFFHLLSSG